MTGEDLNTAVPALDLSSNYFVLFQFADPSDGDRARPAGEELDLHEERQERLNTTIERQGTTGGHLRCGVNQR